jgi:hypothetical protein
VEVGEEEEMPLDRLGSIVEEADGVETLEEGGEEEDGCSKMDFVAKMDARLLPLEVFSSTLCRKDFGNVEKLLLLGCSVALMASCEIFSKSSRRFFVLPLLICPSVPDILVC